MEPFATAAVAPTTDDQQDAPRPPHVVLLASPGAGHLIPLAELARRLADHHAVAATLVIFADDPAIPDVRSAVLSSLPSSVATATLPAVPLDDLPADTRVETVIFELVQRSLPHLRELLRSMSIAALVPDFFCSAVLSVAAELGVPGYIFFPTSITALSLMRRTVELHDFAAAGEQRALPDPLELPGGVSLRTAEFPEAFRDSNALVYGQLVEKGRLYRGAAGFLANSFYELEPAAEEDSKKAAEKGTFPPVYPVGPFVRSSSDEPGESAFLDWLDLQPAASVVFVSFGSAGMLSVEQTRELAAGLEMSGHRFLWVVRMPSLNDGESFAFGSNGAHRNGGHDDDPLAWLPDGFLERTSGRGIAVAGWAPQVRVLSHPATAAFLSHCGWNSTLESVAAGVPMIVWPLHAEQRMNAVVLEESVGVALRPRAREDDVGGAVVRRGEIAAVVKEMLEGEKGLGVRRRARELQQAVGRVWSPEGSSRRALEEIADKWKAAAKK